MRPNSVAVVLCVLFVLSALSPAVMAAPEDEEIPNIRILFEDRSYAVGEQLNVTLEFTVNGRLVNADLNTVALVVIWNFTFGEGGPTDLEWYSDTFESTDPNYIDRVDTGIYKLTIDIKPEHVTKLLPMGEGLPFMSQVVFMMAMCDYGGGSDPVKVQTMAMAVVEEGPSIQVTISDPYPSPGGDPVIITVATTNVTPVDAADVIVNLVSYDGTNLVDLGNLTVNRESIGVYKASYTIPVDLDMATMYQVRAGASFADYNDSAYLTQLFPTGFMVNFFDIWIQNVSATNDETELAMWIADLDGSALEDIDVDVTIAVHNSGGTTPTDLSNTTDANGKAGFTVSHPSADRVDIWGNVTNGVFTQSFYMEAMIDNSGIEAPEPDPDEEDFYVSAWEVPEGDIFDSIKYPGDTIETTYRAFQNDTAVVNKRINWMLVDMDGFFDSNYTIIESGYEVTDATGDFDITYELPSNDVSPYLMFQAVLWNADEEENQMMESTQALIDAGFFPVDENIKISVDRLHKDSPVELRAIVPLPESYFIGHLFAVLDEETGRTMWGQPMSLGPETDDFPITPLQKLGPNIFGIDKQLPDFFPEDQSAAFLVLSVDLIAFRIQTNYVVIGYGESTTKGVDANPEENDPVHAGNQGWLEVAVDNTGAGTDTFNITQDSGPDWLEWEVDAITLEPSESGHFTAYVNVPPDADEDTYFFNFTVTSGTDPGTNISVESSIGVMVNGVAVSVDPLEHEAFRQETVNYVLTINNTGQGSDNYTITLEGSMEDWASLSHYTVAVPENGESEVVVQVYVPDEADEESYWLNATVTSSDEMTSDVVTMDLEVFVDGVSVEAEEGMVPTRPAYTVSIWFNITNTGQGTDTFTFTLEGDPAGWSVLSNESAEVEEGEMARVLVEVTPPGDTDEDWYALTLVATSSNGITNDSAITTIYVEVNGVEITSDEPEKTGYQGGQVAFGFILVNTGQGRDVYTLSHEGADWAEMVLFLKNPVGIDEGTEGGVGVTVTLPDDISEGTYRFTVTATSQDGVTSDSVEFTMNVVVNGVSISLSENSVSTKPGKTVEVTLTIENTGEGSDTYRIMLGGDARNWTTLEMEEVTIAEGGTADVLITIEVPKDVQFPGSSAAVDAFLDITVESSDPNFSEWTQFQVIVVKPDEPSGLSFAVVGIIIAVALLVFIAIFYMVVMKK